MNDVKFIVRTKRESLISPILYAMAYRRIYPITISAYRSARTVRGRRRGVPTPIWERHQPGEYR
ncbi:MAG: hypothetical protein LBN29_14315 [Mediterranea sp.]|jgi:hypothetical protein|nr:hypothetical protein [Mediterranea sp.]